MKENAPAGTLVASVSLVSAEEKADFFIVGCDSERGRERGLFSVDRSSGQIRTAAKVDREAEGDKVVLQVVAVVGEDAMSGCKVRSVLRPFEG
jgi:hypothetical protein